MRMTAYVDQFALVGMAASMVHTHTSNSGCGVLHEILRTLDSSLVFMIMVVLVAVAGACQ